MQIVVVGYGRMGHEVERIAAKRGHTTLCRIDPHAEDADFASVGAAREAGMVSGETVVVEFALPDGVEANMAEYARAGSPVVMGTTGWEDRREAVLARAREAGIGVVWGANFSVGAALFTRITRHAAQLADRVEGYDAAIVELHHRGKQDSPSGTARMVAAEVLAASSTKSRSHEETLHRRIHPEELHVASLRVGAVPGTHTVYLDSSADTVELTHRARNRGGFALGAVRAGEWIAEVGGVHPVDEYFAALFGG